MATHSAFLGYLLWLLVGVFGVHRFYFGKRTTAVLYFVTAAAASAGGLVYLFGTRGTALVYAPIAAGIVFLAWLVDLFLIPRMKKQVSGRYQYGRYSYATGWLLLVFLGLFGAHHFYVGNYRRGVLYLLTLGLLGIGVIYDYFTFNDTLSDRNEQWISGEPGYSFSTRSPYESAI